MELTPLGLDGVWLAQSPVWSDDRGSFREWFKAEDIRLVTGRDFGIEQANISISSKGTLRGIHYSLAPRGQAKWVTCISGAIQDVVVDIRPNSKTFGQWIDVELRGDSGKIVFISEGLGHGFLALEDNTTVAYLVSTPFSPLDEYEINPTDPELGIEWGQHLLNGTQLTLSQKDSLAPTLKNRHLNGELPSYE
jgi:dTDP-4-dehydrorhamnose 3,5-epimerase